jgi:murein DD-endopeptidase MepM/ murein hydrolase activator NlpD
MNFDQIGKQYVSKRRRPSPLKTKQRSAASFDAQFSQDVWPRAKSAGEPAHPRNAQASKLPGAAGFSIPLSWVKNLMVVAGVLVIGVVGTNWDSIAATFKLGEVSLQTLQDTAAYEIMEASYRPTLPTTEVVVREDIPIDVTEMFAWSEYQVREGDTISGIATRFSISAGSIIAFNNIQEAWNIRAGKVLKIPNMDGIPYTVGRNDSISKIAVKMKVPQNAILDANNILSDTIQSGQVLFIPGARMDANEFNRAFKRDATRRDVIMLPVGGKVTSGYGWREDPVRPVAGEKRFHRGVDFIGKTGDPIKAAMKGTVLHIDNNPNLGNFVILKHDGGLQTLYAHLSAYSVKAGDTVNQGQEIGKIGATGYTTGPHLHFEVFRNGNRVDPLDLYK